MPEPEHAPVTPPGPPGPPTRWPGHGPARVAWVAGYPDEPLVIELMAPDGATLQARLVIAPGYELIVGERPGYDPTTQVRRITADEMPWADYDGPPSDFSTPTVPGVTTTGPSSETHRSSVNGTTSSDDHYAGPCIICGASVVRVGGELRHAVDQPHRHDPEI